MFTRKHSINFFALFLWVPFALAQGKTADLIRFQDPGSVSSHLLQQPHAIAFDAQGRLYAVDSKQAQVFFWETSGMFIGAFAKKGQGPGELQFPTAIATIDNQIWVTDGASQKLHIFSRLGAFQKSVALPMPARVMAALDSQTALIGARTLDPRNKTNEMTFYLLDLTTGSHSILKSWPNHTIDVNDKGEWRWKAFGDDIDVQRLPDGTVVFGFSQDPELFQLAQNKRVQPLVSLKVPGQKPSDSDREWVKSMSFPGSNGQRFKLDKNTNWQWDFSNTKAPYTHFLIKDQKILLALTPLGSIQGVGGGYFKGTYLVLDRANGEPLHRGSFEYPEDSTVFFKDGRIVGFLLDSEGNFEIRELSLEGF